MSGTAENKVVLQEISTKNMTHEEWLEARQAGIGGSDAGAICGLNPYRSSIDVWMDKMGKAPEKPDNEAMRVGRDLEQYVADRFTERTGLKVRKDNHIIINPEYSFMLANVDRRIVGENALLECKTVSPYNAYLWKDGNCPASYEVQCHHYMAVTGAAKVYLAALIMGMDFVVVEIPRDEEVIRYLRNIEQDFWTNFIETGEMPAPDGSEAAAKAIRELFPESAEKTVDLSFMQPTIERIDQITQLEDELKREKDGLKQQIQLHMEDADTAFIGERKITWKTSKPRVTVDSKRLKEEMPVVYKAFSKEGKPTRTFRIW